MDFWGHERKKLVKCQTKSPGGCLHVKTGLMIISDFVNWIRVMQGFEAEF